MYLLIFLEKLSNLKLTKWDEWTLEEELAIVERDWQELLKMAIFRFKYPRVEIAINE